MARISGVNIPVKKCIPYALTYIKGIGRISAFRICEVANVNPTSRVQDLTEDEVARIRDIIDQEYTVEGELNREISMNIKRLMDLGCYRGLRHRRGLPVRGQESKRNARTRKGPRKTVAGKKK